MKTLAKTAFYLLFAFGAIRLFKGLSHLWPLLYGDSAKPPIMPVESQRRYYRFDYAAPMDKSQVILLIATGLAMIVLAFFIRNKMVEKDQST